MIKSDVIQKDFSFAQGRVNVFIISVDKNRRLLPFYDEHLSIDEKEKASRFKFKIDRERFTIARAILRILSSRFQKTDAKQIQFNYNEFGKPSYQKNQRLKFNVSHSSDVIVIGFTNDYEIGVDIELIKADFEPLKLAQNFFSKTEISCLEKQSKNNLPRAFFRCWTRKESFIKAEGSGLSFPLDKFAVSIDGDEKAELLKTDWDFSERLNWNLFSFTPNSQYIGAIAVRNRQSSVAYFDWDALTKHAKPTSNNLR